MRLLPMGLLVESGDARGVTLALIVPAMQTAEFLGMTVKLVGIETVAQITVSQN